MLQTDPDDTPQTPYHTDSPRPVPPEDPRPEGAVAERRVARILGAVAALAVVVAVALNAAFSPSLSNGPSEKALVLASHYEPGLPSLSKKPLQMLPSEVLAYETMARQGMPGRSERAAEAIYVTMNMNVEQQVSMSVYARVEGFVSGSDARVKQAEIMRDYPLEAKSLMVNGVRLARAGYGSDKTSYAVTWLDGQYLTYVKATFRDGPTARRQLELLKAQADPVVEAVEGYQRTGKQGIEIGAQHAKSKTATKAADPKAPHLGTPNVGADW